MPHTNINVHLLLPHPSPPNVQWTLNGASGNMLMPLYFPPLNKNGSICFFMYMLSKSYGKWPGILKSHVGMNLSNLWDCRCKGMDENAANIRLCVFFSAWARFEALLILINLRTVPPIVSAHPFCASRETLPRARPRVSPDAYSMLTSICKKNTLQRAVC